ncbi:MAG: YceI family protein [Bacteroidota bacterium]|nr:YceI family protein [Bacteroidota bacterium]
MKKFAWRFSAVGSTIDFKIKYFSISNISGNFEGFWGTVNASEGFENPEVEVTLDTVSINVNNERRNKKIRSTACLHAREYPNVLFRAKDGCKLSEGKIRELTGELTIKNITREITLVINYSHMKKGHNPAIIVFSLFGCFSRKDFNLSMEDDKLDDEIYLNAFLELSRTDEK